MSEEPRIRLLKNGSVLGSIWEAPNGDLVLEEEESGRALRIGSLGAAVNKLDATTIEADSADILNTATATTINVDNLVAKSGSAIDISDDVDLELNNIQNVGSLSTGRADIGNIAQPDGTTTAAIRDARDRAGVGGTILLDPGVTYTGDGGLASGSDGTQTYYYEIPLLDGQTLWGDATVKSPANVDVGTDAYGLVGPNDLSKSYTDIRIGGGLTLDMDRANQSNGKGNWECVNLKDVSGFEVDVECLNAVRDGVDLDNCSEGIVRGRAENCGKSAVHPSTGTTDVQVIGFESVDNAEVQSAAAYSTVSSSNGVTYLGCTSFSDHIGFRVDGNNISLIGCNVATPVASYITTDQGCNGLDITGGRYDSNNTNDIVGFDFSSATATTNTNFTISPSFVYSADDGIGNTLVLDLPGGSGIVGGRWRNDNGRIIQFKSAIDDSHVRSATLTSGGFYPVDMNSATNSSVVYNTIRSSVTDTVRNPGTGSVESPNVDITP